VYGTTLLISNNTGMSPMTFNKSHHSFIIFSIGYRFRPTFRVSHTDEITSETAKDIAVGISRCAENRAVAILKTEVTETHSVRCFRVLGDGYWLELRNNETLESKVVIIPDSSVRFSSEAYTREIPNSAIPCVRSM